MRPAWDRLEDRRLMAVDPAEALGNEFRVNTFTVNDQLTSQFGQAADSDADGDSVVVWMSSGQDGAGWGVYGQRYDANGLPAGGEFLVNTTTLRDQQEASVAMSDDGAFVVTWQSFDGGGLGVFARRFSAAGVAQGPEFRVNTTTLFDQGFAEVGMDADGDFVVAWGGNSTDTTVRDIGIVHRRYAADGTPLGGEVKVDASTTDLSRFTDSAVAVDDAGNYVITWTQFENVSFGQFHVYAQRYAANGSPLGGITQVDNDANNPAPSQTNRLYVDAAVDDGGDYVIAWSRNHTSSSEWDVHARRYESDGTPKAGQFLVNSTTTSTQVRPAVDADAEGNFVVAWEGYGADNAYGVQLQQYNAAGARIDGELIVNQTRSVTAAWPSVAMADDGDFLVAWSRPAAAPTTYDVYARRYSVHTNDAPVLAGGGSYTVAEGASVTLVAGATDADGDAISYAWDLDNDGTFETPGQSATFSAAGLDDGTYVVGVRASDGSLSVTGSAVVLVTNVAPAVDSLATNAGVIGGVSENGQVNLAAAFSDPGVPDTHSASIDWGDGTAAEAGAIDKIARTVAASHAYAAGGRYLVTLTLTDDDGGVATRSALVFVTGSGVHNGVLHVIGTAGADRIDVIPKDGKIKAGANFLPGTYRLYEPSAVQRVYLATGPGDDKLNMWETVNALGVMDGGPGNDEMWAGLRTLLIGGAGADKINGANGDDILVASPTTLDGDLPALLAVLGGSRQFSASEMINDGASDTLWGHRGTDEYWGNFRGDGVIDTINTTYLRPDEQIFDV